MSKYEAPLREMRFALFDVLRAEETYARLPGGDAATRDLLDAVFDEAARFTGQVLAPLNKPADEEGCHFDHGTVTTPKGFKEAYAQFIAGGWAGLVAAPEYGGQGWSRVAQAVAGADFAAARRAADLTARFCLRFTRACAALL